MANPPTTLQPTWGYFPRLFNMLSAPALGPSPTGAGNPGAASATCLRWWVSIDLGIPRMPFQVWAARPAIAVSITPQNLGNGVFGVDSQGPLMIFQATVTRTAAALTVEALDDQGAPLPGQLIVVPAAQSTARVQFYYPNISQVRIKGGTLASPAGLAIRSWLQTFIAGKPLALQSVGLPLDASEIAVASYAAGTNGKTDAITRVQQALTTFGSPAPLPAFSGSFAWPADSASALIDSVRVSGGLLSRIQEVLLRPEPAQPVLGWQADQEVMVATNGLSSDPTLEPASDGAAGTGLRIIPLALMAAATDPLISVALGFGTVAQQSYVQSAGIIMPPGYGVPIADVIVTANYLLPFDDGWKWATLIAVSPPPLPAVPSVPVGLAAAPCQLIPPNEPNPQKQRPLRNPPLIADGPFRQDVRLTWNRSVDDLPGGFVLVAVRGGAKPVAGILNQREGNHILPMLPAQRVDGDAAIENQLRFVDMASSVPLTGSRMDQYYCAALDVFGRFSTGWAQTQLTLQAEPPQVPAIVALSLRLPANPVSRQMKASMHGTWSWNIEDRTPRRVEFAGVFFDPATGPPASPPGTPPVSFQLDFSSNPPAPLPDTESAGKVNRYDLPPRDIDIDFNAGSELRLALYARAWETVNASAASAWSPPVTAVVMDPVLPALPPFTPVLRWSTLSDAMGVSRATISFPAVPFATAYVAFEADDVAIFDARNVLPQFTDPQKRLTELAPVAGLTEVRDVYRRVFRDPIPAPKIEVELPGQFTGIRAYRIAAVSATQVESAWSDPVYVAVPRRQTPQVPELYIPAFTGNTVTVRVQPASKGPITARVQLYRTTSAELSADLDLMGPPLATLYRPDKAEADFVFEFPDTPAPAWRQYYYRAVAFGPNDPDNGRFAGRSLATRTGDALMLPAGPPDLTNLRANLSLSSGGLSVTFQSSAEIRPSPLGPHRVLIATVTPSLYPKHIQPIVDTDLVTGSPRFTRSAQDQNGRWGYALEIPAAEQVLVRMIDPRGRTTELRATGNLLSLGHGPGNQTL